MMVYTPLPTLQATLRRLREISLTVRIRDQKVVRDIWIKYELHVNVIRCKIKSSAFTLENVT